MNTPRSPRVATPGRRHHQGNARGVRSAHPRAAPRAAARLRAGGGVMRFKTAKMSDKSQRILQSTLLRTLQRARTCHQRTFQRTLLFRELFGEISEHSPESELAPRAVPCSATRRDAQLSKPRIHEQPRTKLPEPGTRNLRRDLTPLTPDTSYTRHPKP